MKTYYWHIVWMISCLFLLAGCDTEEDTNPILPGQVAVLTIEFSPQTVYQGYSDTFEYTIIVTEISGVGAWVTSAKAEVLDKNGDVLDTFNYDEDKIREDVFGTSYIEPNGKLFSQRKLECTSCVRENWRLRIEDDFGNRRDYTGTVELIQR